MAIPFSKPAVAARQRRSLVESRPPRQVRSYLMPFTIFKFSYLNFLIFVGCLQHFFLCLLNFYNNFILLCIQRVAFSYCTFNTLIIIYQNKYNQVKKIAESELPYKHIIAGFYILIYDSISNNCI